MFYPLYDLFKPFIVQNSFTLLNAMKLTPALLISACMGMLITGCETTDYSRRSGYSLDSPQQGAASRYGYLGVEESEGRTQGTTPGAPPNRYGAGSGLTQPGPSEPLPRGNDSGRPSTSPEPENSQQSGVKKPAERPYADPVPGKYGRVFSPFAKGKEIDVADFSPGTLVRCPYTQKIFRVP